jgi:translation initiation factor IF-3
MEVKNIQIKIGTGENDMMLKAKRASEWLREGHRLKIELYLRGRAKYVLEKDFLHNRVHKFMNLLTENYKIVEDFKKVPKGISVIVERDKSAKPKTTPDTNTSADKPTDIDHE